MASPKSLRKKSSSRTQPHRFYITERRLYIYVLCVVSACVLGVWMCVCAWWVGIPPNLWVALFCHSVFVYSVWCQGTHWAHDHGIPKTQKCVTCVRYLSFVTKLLCVVLPGVCVVCAHEYAWDVFAACSISELCCFVIKLSYLFSGDKAPRLPMAPAWPKTPTASYVFDI